MVPILLVIADKNIENWVELCKIYSNEFRVIQALWSQISLISFKYTEKVQIKITPLNPSENTINFSPDLVLIRILPRSTSNKIDFNPDYRNILYGFYHSNTHLINPFSSILCDLERPLMFGRLNKIVKKYGYENFPLIPQYYYPEYSQIFITPNPPFVIKVGFSHSGSKILIKDNHDLDDVKSLLAINNKKTYSLIEPYVQSEYQIKIIFIAPNYYKVFKCSSMGWKINLDYKNIENNLEISLNMKKWCDLIYKNYSDFYMFSIDAIIDKNNKEFIVDVCGCCMKLNENSKKEDLINMRNLVVRKMEIVLNKEIIKNKNEELKNLFNWENSENFNNNENNENNENEKNENFNENNEKNENSENNEKFNFKNIVNSENSEKNLKSIENIVNPSNLNSNVIKDINLKNQIEKKNIEIEEKNEEIEKLKNDYNNLFNDKLNIQNKNDFYYSIFICVIIIVYLGNIIMKNKIKIL